MYVEQDLCRNSNLYFFSFWLAYSLLPLLLPNVKIYISLFNVCVVCVCVCAMTYFIIILGLILIGQLYILKETISFCHFDKRK